ncbi:hypothetical protein DFS34DRAFT_619743 [Phlyctochytrium arcticum]|nr:hypothetical protein DFS34DRAFT_619743 [Phlyctochytrium arcticum]
MSEDNSGSRKRPLDLAALRQEQLQKRAKAAENKSQLKIPAKSTGPTSAAETASVPAAKSRLTRLPSRPFLTQIPLEPKLVRPGLFRDASSDDVKENKHVRLSSLGSRTEKLDPDALISLNSDDPPSLPTLNKSLSHNPFSTGNDSTRESKVKQKNPFSAMESFASSQDNASQLDLVPEEEEVNFFSQSTEVGSLVMEALSQNNSHSHPKSAPTFARSFSSLPAVASPHVSLSKKPRASFTEYLEASSHYRNDSDVSDTSDMEDSIQLATGYMSDPENDEPVDKESHNIFGAQSDSAEIPVPLFPVPQKPSDSDLRELEDYTEDQREDIDIANPAFLQLLTGKLRGTARISDKEISAIEELSTVRKAEPSSVDKAAPVAKSRPSIKPQEVKRRQGGVGTEIPLDWSLKTEITLLCTSAMPCSSDTPIEDSNMIMDFTQQGLHHRRAKTLQPYLYHWIYPAQPTSPSHVALMTKVLSKEADGTALKEYEKLELAHYKKSEQTWKKSFISALSMIQTCLSDYFYYLNSQFSVLFISKSRSARADHAAYMSTSTPGIRKILTQEGINFSAKRPKTRLEQQEERTGRTRNENDVIEVRDLKDDPDQEYYPLQFIGKEAMEKLHHFLLNWTEPRTDRRAMSQPLIISPRPFMNASIKCAEVTQNAKVRYNDVEVGGKKVEVLYKVHINGFVLPTYAYEMLSLVREEQVVKGENGALLMVTARSEKRTTGLNSAAGGTYNVRGYSGRKNADNEEFATITSLQCKNKGVRWQ